MSKLVGGKSYASCTFYFTVDLSYLAVYISGEMGKEVPSTTSNSASSRLVGMLRSNLFCLASASLNESEVLSFRIERSG